MYKLCFFVPLLEKEGVKEALFALGVGRYENYDCCSWETEGVGQFRALAGSTPFIGSENILEKVVEWKVEMICRDALIEEAIVALRQAHPYEEPAFEVTRMEFFGV